ncbi:acyl-CoA reductase [Gramella sp. AN32]|uniref:Acyl-CoA reductase n=1 Tax=Christiangramia antarctica TaxID=2058158 RepID=A0ABW5X9S9_9FLAO|nr:acyl-CoA reductase [Gramella sp. AN32]MCM4157419.1 acyl-CoA reductase [Gramella sp. AN32]
MTIDNHKSHLVELGKFLGQFQLEKTEKDDTIKGNARFFEKMQQEIDAAVHYNGWFNKENVIFALQQWSQALTPRNLHLWLTNYTFKPLEEKTVGIVMAGNIPLVGLHDFISVLVCGHKLKIKLSSNDQRLVPLIAEYLKFLDSRYENRILFVEDHLKGFDAVIATGSDNTARYFEHYFKGKPSIIRKNRNSVAIITGEESKEELAVLGEDIFRYYGLGCRNVSKLYVPKNFKFDNFFEAIYSWNDIINQNKYANNYDYNKAVYLMSEFKLLDNGFLMLKEDARFGSPIATLFYEQYEDENDLQLKLKEQEDKIQCIVKNEADKTEVSFGKTQHPELWDYADNVDTIEFLLNL